MKEYIWNYRASQYDNLDWVKNKVFLNTLFKICNPNHKHTVLDIGAGTGSIANILARRVKTVIGIDSSKKMLRKARHNCVNKNIIYKNMNAVNLQFKSNYFDLVTARIVFHHTTIIA